MINLKENQKLSIQYIICSFMVILFTILWYIDCISVSTDYELHSVNVSFQQLWAFSGTITIVFIFANCISVMSLLLPVVLKKFDIRFVGLSIISSIISFVILIFTIGLISELTSDGSVLISFRACSHKINIQKA